MNYRTLLAVATSLFFVLPPAAQAEKKLAIVLDCSKDMERLEEQSRPHDNSEKTAIDAFDGQMRGYKGDKITANLYQIAAEKDGSGIVFKWVMSSPAWSPTTPFRQAKFHALSESPIVNASTRNVCRDRIQEIAEKSDGVVLVTMETLGSTVDLGNKFARFIQVQKTSNGRYLDKERLEKDVERAWKDFLAWKPDDEVPPPPPPPSPVSVSIRAVQDQVYMLDEATFDVQIQNANDCEVDFGDGTAPQVVRSGAPVKHVYGKTGDFTVRSVAGNANAEAAIHVVEPFVEGFQVDPTKGFVGTPVRTTFILRGTTLAEIDFGDGKLAKTIRVGSDGERTNEDHVYDTENQYLIRLTPVKDGVGGVRQRFVPVSETVFIKAPPQSPVVTIRPNQEKVERGTVCTFTLDLTNADTAKIDFGDNTQSTHKPGVISHLYKAAGSYVVVATAVSKDNLSETGNCQVEVSAPPPPPPPEVELATDPAGTTAVDEETDVAFTVSARNAKTVTVDFGDGSAPMPVGGFQNGPARVHCIFRKPGQYKVSLTGVGEGGSSTKELALLVKKAPAPPVVARIESVMDITDGNETVLESEDGTFSVDSYTTLRFLAEERTNVVSYVWTIAPENAQGEDGESMQIEGREADYEFKPGRYTVELEVTAADGRKNGVRRTVDVAPPPPPPPPPYWLLIVLVLALTVGSFFWFGPKGTVGVRDRSGSTTMYKVNVLNRQFLLSGTEPELECRAAKTDSGEWGVAFRTTSGTCMLTRTSDRLEISVENAWTSAYASGTFEQTSPMGGDKTEITINS